MKITSKKLPNEKFYCMGYLVAEYEQYELKTFYDGKNFRMIYVGFSLYKAKKKFIQHIETGYLKPLTKI